MYFFVYLFLLFLEQLKQTFDLFKENMIGGNSVGLIHFESVYACFKLESVVFFLTDCCWLGLCFFWECIASLAFGGECVGGVI